MHYFVLALYGNCVRILRTTSKTVVFRLNRTLSQTHEKSGAIICFKIAMFYSVKLPVHQVGWNTVLLVPSRSEERPLRAFRLKWTYFTTYQLATFEPLG